MKLIIELIETTGTGTISLPALIEDGCLDMKSRIEEFDSPLRCSGRVFYTAEYLADTALRMARLERHIFRAITEFYKAEGLTDNTPCRYPLEPLD